MGGYFKPLRRKLGVMTLVVACVFVGGWVRSAKKVDRIIKWGRVSYSLLSHDGVFDFARTTYDRGDVKLHDRGLFLFGVEYGYFSHNIENDPEVQLSQNTVRTWGGPFAGCEVEWRRDWVGFTFGAGRWGRRRVEMVVIPYWSIVIPLTLISAYLLLSKPRKSNRTHAEPIPETMA